MSMTDAEQAEAVAHALAGEHLCRSCGQWIEERFYSACLQRCCLCNQRKWIAPGCEMCRGCNLYHTHACPLRKDAGFEK